MKTPNIVTECGYCGINVISPAHKVWAGVSREGGTVVYVDVRCPDCGHTESVRLSE